jgi:hypothetical protein
VYQGQQVHLFHPSRSFLAEAQPCPKTGEDKRHFLAEVHIKFFRRRTNYKAKDIIYFLSVISLPTKLEIYYLQLLIYLHNLW